MENVPWDSNTTTLTLLKNDERNQTCLLKSKYRKYQMETKSEQAKINVSAHQQNQFYHAVSPIENPLGSVFNLTESNTPTQRKNAKNLLRTYRDSRALCNMTNGDFTFVPSSSERYVYTDTNYRTSRDNCDENSQGNSCSQLLLDSFPSTTVPNTVASFSSSSSTSAPHENIILPGRGRLKRSLPRKREHGGHMLQRQSSLLSLWSRRFFLYRKKCHSTVGDAVLSFMLFLAMLHLSW